MTDTMARRAHWEEVYATKAEDEVSWFQEHPAMSLDLIRAAGVGPDAAVIDVGGGASRLVDALLDEGFHAVTVLDLSEKALAASRVRLGPQRASRVTWIAADATTWQPKAAAYDLWHDRAAFHFLTDAPGRAAYVERLAKALRPGGHAVIATFAADGPERCSGLPVVRYDAASLAAALGDRFERVETRPHEHHTPMGRIQRFQFSRFRKTG